MMKLIINGNEYKVRFGYNSFCDNDVFDRVRSMLSIMNGEAPDETAALNRVRDLFKVTRDLLFIGFKKYNPVKTPEEVGDLLDDYYDEAAEGEDHGLMQLFLALSEELMNEGFLSDLTAASQKPKRTTKAKK